MGLADLVRRKQVAAEELLESAIARVEARNPQINAVTMKLYDHGRQAIANGLPDGPFRGVPYLMKDLTASIAGVTMTRGSKFFADTPPSPIDSEHVSRQHAHIVSRDAELFIEDLGSTNGTFVNGKLIEKSPLKPGDIIAFGKRKFLFVAKHRKSH